MKRIKTFEQYNSSDTLNEGIIMDVVNKYSGKLKELIKSGIAKFSINVDKLRTELAPFKGMSLEQIKQELQTRSTTANESVARKVFNFTGLALFSTFVTSLATMIADVKWDFLHKVFNLHDVGGNIALAGGLSFCALILWLFVKLDSQEESWADATRPSGTSSAERHSSGYIASQMKRNNR